MPALSLDALSLRSREFADRLFAALPELMPYARMEAERNGARCELVIEAPSCTGDLDRVLFLWIDAGSPSVGLDPHWHTHADLQGRDGHRILNGWSAR